MLWLRQCSLAIIACFVILPNLGVFLKALPQQLSPWRAYRSVPSSILPRAWRNWVLDRGSLTQRLIDVSGGQFRVRVTRLHWAMPAIDEARTLSIPFRQQALIREVELCVFGVPWVRAHSVIPVGTLRGEERQLQYLGEKPLGAFLFSSRAMKREALELARFSNEQDEICFARRSVFRLHNKPLLVSEMFLPEVLRAS